MAKAPSAPATMSKQQATLSKQRSTLSKQHSTLLPQYIVAKNGNNVEATFDIVQRILRLVAFDSVAWTLLLVWTGLKRTACWLAACLVAYLCLKHRAFESLRVFCFTQEISSY